MSTYEIINILKLYYENDDSLHNKIAVSSNIEYGTLTEFTMKYDANGEYEQISVNLVCNEYRFYNNSNVISRHPENLIKNIINNIEDSESFQLSTVLTEYESKCISVLKFLTETYINPKLDEIIEYDGISVYTIITLYGLPK